MISKELDTIVQNALKKEYTGIVNYGFSVTAFEPFLLTREGTVFPAVLQSAPQENQADKDQE